MEKTLNFNLRSVYGRLCTQHEIIISLEVPIRYLYRCRPMRISFVDSSHYKFLFRKEGEVDTYTHDILAPLYEIVYLHVST